MREPHARAAASFTRIFAAALFILGTDAAAITFDDGLVHVIDAGNSFPFEDVIAVDGPGGVSTTVDMRVGGEVGGAVVEAQLYARENSIVFMSGGVIDSGLVASGNSDVTVTDGSILVGLGASGFSTVLITGGAIGNPSQGTYSSLTMTESAVVDVTGGTIDHVANVAGGVLNAFGGTFKSDVDVHQGGIANFYGGIVQASAGAFKDGKLNIRGGEFQGLTRAIDGGGGGVNDAVLNVSGGLLDDIFVDHFSTATLSGGSFTSITVAGGTTVNFWGGTLGGELIAAGQSTIRIYGSGFNFPFGDITAMSGTLTGTLADSTPINAPFGRASTATITLPEPSALTALGSGIAMLALLYRRRGASSRKPWIPNSASLS